MRGRNVRRVCAGIRKQEVWIILALVVAGFLPTTATGGEPRSSVEAGVPVLIGVMEGQRPGSPHEFLGTYESYDLVRMSARDTAWLEERGIPFVRLPDPGVVGLRSIRGPLADSGAEGLPKTPHLAIVQFAVPPREEWVRAIEASGARALAYIPNYAYLVLMPADAARVVGAWPGSSRLFAYDPHLKLSPSLDASDLRVRLVLVADSRFDNPRDILRRWNLRPEAYWTRGALAFAEVFSTPDAMAALAREPSVVWIEPAPLPAFFDEVAVEILGGYWTPNVPWDGPGSFVQTVGWTGAGIRVAIADTGLDTGDNTTMHPDLAGRVHAFIDYGESDPTDGVAEDGYGHGTHVAGIVAGTGASTGTDADGYLYGIGIAPNASLVVQRLSDDGGQWKAPSFMFIAEHASRYGASVSSNSWGALTMGEYDWSAAEYDILTRDADLRTPGEQPLLHVFAAANSGPGPSTLASPGTAKNLITVGATENFRPLFGPDADDPQDLAFFSSRGPATDGRVKPDIVAPGFYVASALSSLVSPGLCGGALDALHEACSGTSMATPQVAGGAAVFQQYFADRYGVLPSPAMTKAALINTARDIAGDGATAPIPNNDEGWGIMDLVALLDPGGPEEFADDQARLLAVGQTETYQITVTSSAQPLRITLAYTDAPAAGFASPTLVNDLDLVVTDPAGRTYWGNTLVNGWSLDSVTGGDRLNNLENVFLQSPAPGVYRVQILAVNVPVDGAPLTPALDQDFALYVRAEMAASPVGSVSWDREYYPTPATGALVVVDTDLNADPGVQETSAVTVTSTTEPAGEVVTVTEAGLDSALFLGNVALRPGAPVSDGLLQVGHGDVVNATYQDVNPPGITYDLAEVDSVPPAISGVFGDASVRTAWINFTTDEVTRGSVEYGVNPSLGSFAQGYAYADSHGIHLMGLQSNTTYFFLVSAVDAAGNQARDDNGGALYTLSTMPTPPILFVDDDLDDSPSEFVTALAANGYSFDVVQRTASSDILDDYQVVIWTTGDDFFEPLSPSEQNALAVYLDGGGNLFLSSRDLLFWGLTSFATDYLHISGSSYSNEPVASIQGIPGDAISAEFPYVALRHPEGPRYLTVVFPDAIATETFTEPSMDQPVAVKANTGVYRTIFFSFPFESVHLADPWTGTLLLRRVLEWFGLTIPVDVAVTALDVPRFAPPGQQIQIGATVANLGIAPESNLAVTLRVNGLVVDSLTIPLLDPRASAPATFFWTPSTEGDHVLAVEVAPVPGETVLANNAIARSVGVTSVRPVTVAVVDSLGTVFPDFWKSLEANWFRYGSVPLVADVTTLAKSGFTPQEIASTEADALAISCGSREYTPGEVDAIVEYVSGGRGLVGTCTLSPFTPGNAPLAALWGIREDVPITFSSPEPLFPTDPQHPLFRNISVPYTPASATGFGPADDRSWDGEDLSTGAYAAVSSPARAMALVTNGLNVYLSTFTDYIGPSPSEDDFQLMYNAVTWAGSGAGVAINVTAPSTVEALASFDIVARVHSTYDIRSATAWFHPPGGMPYEAVAMSLVSGGLTDGNWSATIPGQTVVGDMSVYVEVTNVWGKNASSSMVTLAVVDLTSPVILDLTAGTPVTGARYTFAASVLDFRVSAASVEYWYGDGAHVNASMNLVGARHEHTITVLNTTEPLSYRLAAVDVPGHWSSTAVRTMDVSDPHRPVAVANDPFELPQGRVATFNGSGSRDNVGIVNYTWLFSDGVTLYGKVVHRTMENPGQYNVTLRIRDAAGNHDEANTFVLVLEINPPGTPIHVSAVVGASVGFLALGLALGVLLGRARFAKAKEDDKAPNEKTQEKPEPP